MSDSRYIYDENGLITGEKYRETSPLNAFGVQSLGFVICVSCGKKCLDTHPAMSVGDFLCESCFRRLVHGAERLTGVPWELAGLHASPKQIREFPAFKASLEGK